MIFIYGSAKKGNQIHLTISVKMHMYLYKDLWISQFLLLASRPLVDHL